MRVPLPRALLAAGLFVSAGCAATRSLGVSPAGVDLRGEGLAIEQTPETFGRAVSAYHEARYAEALGLFRLLAEGSDPRSPLASYSAFDGGMSALHLGRPTDAVPLFLEAAASGEPDLTAEARYRLAQAEEGSGRGPEAIDRLSALARDPAAPERVRAEARLRRSVLALERAGGSADEAALLGRGFLEERGEGSPASSLLDPDLLPRAFFDVGAEDLGACTSIDLARPRSTRDLETALDRKAELLLEAQRWLLKAVRVSASARWASRSLATLARAYRDFHGALLRVPLPPDLSEPERKVYVEELRGAIAPLLDEAAWIDGRNVRMASQFGLLDEWVEESRSRLGGSPEGAGSGPKGPLN